MNEIVILSLVVVTAVGFDFTNGFHDTGNAMATSIATGTLKPKVAVGLSAVLNLVGAFLSVEVAVTITRNILKLQDKSGALLPGLSPSSALLIIFTGLVGGILWNLTTWLLGLPASSTHALFGGLIGAGIASRLAAPNWSGIITSVIVPAVLSPVIAGIVSSIATWFVFKITDRINDDTALARGFRIGQTATASLVSLAHGAGDAQKTMGVISLALLASGHLSIQYIDDNGIPWWIVVMCALAMALGTYLGGWRVIRTLGKGLVSITPGQGMAAEASSAAIILTSAASGMALSTTHVATGSILGSGVGKPGASVRWQVAGKMVIAWVFTLPAAAIVGALSYLIAHSLPSYWGAVVIFLVLVVLTGVMMYISHQNKIDGDNVNDEWVGGNIELGDREISASFEPPAHYYTTGSPAEYTQDQKVNK